MNSHSSKDSLFGTLSADTRSGIVVFLIALPLCLGIALASGAPLFSGVVSGIIGGIVVGYLSGSRLSVSGPAAGLTVIVLNGIEKLGTFESFLLAVVLAGLFQIILGFLKAGVIRLFFPTAVIRGMLAAIGLILILKQIPHALGDDRDAEGEFEFFQIDGENTFTEIMNAIGDPAFSAILISLVSFAILLTWNKITQKIQKLELIPASLIVVLAGIAINQLLIVFLPTFALASIHLVPLPVIENLSQVSSLFVFPDFSQWINPNIYLTAGTIAIIASLETLLNIEATDKLDPLKQNTSANQELKAQGVGNLVAGLIGGIPVTSVIVRSSANIYAGAKSKMSAIIHGVLLLISVLFFARFMNLIPLASLAAILILTGYKLAKVDIFKEMYRLGWNQFLPFILTVIMVLFTDLLIGIGIGMAIGFFFILRENLSTSHFLNMGKHKGADYIKIELSEHVSFLNKASIADALEQLPENSMVDIDGTKSTFIDYDVLEVIHDFQKKAPSKNIIANFLTRNGQESLVSEKKDSMQDYLMDFDTTYQNLLENNKEWVAEKLKLDPEYFHKLARGQQPKFLFIGCADSRVHPNEITKTAPGEMFIHRNVANLVVNTDFNLMSVLQYAVEVLKVEHVIVCGHYGCGGVKASLQHTHYGLIDNWLRNIKDVYRIHQAELDALTDENERFKRMVELNVIEQVYNLHKTSIIQKAWNNNAKLRIHGWVYDLKEGIIIDLNFQMKEIFEEYDKIYKLEFPS